MSIDHQGRDRETGHPPRPGRALLVAGGCLFAALALGFLSPHVAAPIIAGDSADYFLMLQSWADHGSPDLRPEEIEALDRLLPGPVPFSQHGHPYAGYRQASNGRWYCMHFWLYPLLALPARALLQASGGNVVAAFQVTNITLFCLTVFLLIFNGRSAPSRRIPFLLLAALGPVIWFLRWPHPEAFTWCCTALSLHVLGQRRYGLSATIAAVGALQNPPLMLLGLIAAGSAVARHRVRGLVVAAGLLPALVAPLFYFYHFGVPSLIAGTGGMDLALISPMRTASLLLDFDQGMLPHLPAVLLFGAAGAVLAVIGKRHLGMALTAGLIGMVIIVQAAPNWNNGTTGPMRYAVWIAPLFAWLAAGYLPWERRRMRVLLAAGLLVQAAIITGSDGRPDYLRRSPLSAWALHRFPALVHPEPEIFTERQSGRDGYFQKQLPAGFVGRDGSLLKVLSTDEALPDICRRFGFTPGDRALRIRRLGRPFPGLLYLHPPRGSINVVEPIEWGGQALARGIDFGFHELPGAILDPHLRLQLRLTNLARFRFWGISSGARHPLDLACRVRDEASGGERIIPVPAPLDLAPGETIFLSLSIDLPRTAGRFHVEIQAALKGLVWGERRVGFAIDVLGADERSYLARIVPDDRWQADSGV